MPMVVEIFRIALAEFSAYLITVYIEYIDVCEEVGIRRGEQAAIAAPYSTFAGRWITNRGISRSPCTKVQG